MSSSVCSIISCMQLFNDVSVEISKHSSVFDSTPNHQQEKTVSRTLALSDPFHLQLLDQLLNNLVSEEPADSLVFIARDLRRPGAT